MRTFQETLNGLLSGVMRWDQWNALCRWRQALFPALSP
jgi:hypothetical protein